MDTFPTEIEAPEPSYNFAGYNKDGVVISYGPKNGLLWRGEAFDKEMSLIKSLNKVFTQGFTQGDEQSCLANLAYIKEKYPNSIYASNTYSNMGEFTGLEHEEASAGDYGYIYLIDTSKDNIRAIPLCEENILNEEFIKNSSDKKDELTINKIFEGPEYAIIPKESVLVDPKYIIGAKLTAFTAFALGLPEKSFILNPAYREVIYLGKIKEISDISLFAAFDTLALKYPNLSIDEVHQKFRDEGIKLDNAQAYANAKTAGQSNFFHRTPSTSTSALDPNAYSQLKF